MRFPMENQSFSCYSDDMMWLFESQMRYWHGPAPWYFLPVPDACGSAIRALSRRLSYGWGVIPVKVRLGTVSFTTSLFPKDGEYLIPVKVAIRKMVGLHEGEVAVVELEVDA